MKISYPIRDKGGNNFSSLDEIMWLIDGETYWIQDKTQWLGGIYKKD